MKTKKVLSVILAVAMMMSLAISASAADISETGDASVTGTADVPLKGTITADEVLLSVVMPTSIDFTVGTKTAAAAVASTGTNGSASAGNEFATLISGSGTVTNNSNVNIKLDITGVTDKNSLLSMIKLGVMSDSVNESSALANALDTSADYTSSPITLASSIAAEGGTTTLSVAGTGLTGTWNSTEYPVNVVAGTYTVTTTMKVSVA